MLTFTIDNVRHKTRIYLVGAREDYLRLSDQDEEDWDEDMWCEVEDFFWIRLVENGKWEVYHIEGNNCIWLNETTEDGCIIGITAEEVVEMVNKSIDGKKIEKIK